MASDRLRSDLEGVCLYRIPAGGYLLVSSQGSSTYAVYDRAPPYAYRGSFAIVAGDLDGTQRTDGIEAVSGFVSGSFPSGLFLAHDAEPTGGRTVKLVPWERIADPLALDR